MKGLILKPVISEKSMNLAARNTYMFEVPLTTNKIEVARAVKETFKVDPVTVRTAVTKGKVKQLRGIKGQRSSIKKAFVTIKKGQSIKAFETEAEK